MSLSLCKNIKITKLRIGKEQLPVLVIDNFIEQVDALVNYASTLTFAKNSQFYPGVRAKAPDEYQHLILQNLHSHFIEYFDLPSQKVSFPLCHYSIVTQAPQQLNLIQRIPHFDSTDRNGLATVHYLFKKPLGGTSFYRHKKTGFEYVDEARKRDYFMSLESENDGPNIPQTSDGYINGETPLYEVISEQAGVHNRMIVYKRNILHSGAIPKNFSFDSSPTSGRLTINCFIDYA